MVNASRYHATDRELELDNVHSIFHSFGVYKMSTKLASGLNIRGPTLRWAPDWDTCSIAPSGPMVKKTDLGIVNNDP